MSFLSKLFDDNIPEVPQALDLRPGAACLVKFGDGSRPQFGIVVDNARGCYQICTNAGTVTFLGGGTNMNGDELIPVTKHNRGLG